MPRSCSAATARACSGFSSYTTTWAPWRASTGAAAFPVAAAPITAIRLPANWPLLWLITPQLLHPVYRIVGALPGPAHGNPAMILEGRHRHLVHLPVNPSVTL